MSKSIIATIGLVVVGMMGILLLFYPLDTYLPNGILQYIPAFLVEEPIMYIFQKNWWILVVAIPLGSLLYILKEWWN